MTSGAQHIPQVSAPGGLAVLPRLPGVCLLRAGAAKASPRRVALFPQHKWRLGLCLIVALCRGNRGNPRWVQAFVWRRRPCFGHHTAMTDANICVQPHGWRSLFPCGSEANSIMLPPRGTHLLILSSVYPLTHPLLLTQTPQGTVGDGRGAMREDGRLPAVGPFTPATLLEHLLWAVGLWTNWI